MRHARAEAGKSTRNVAEKTDRQDTGRNIIYITIFWSSYWLLWTSLESVMHYIN